MSVIILIIFLSILVAGFFLVAYLWSASNGQFDDPDAHAYRILYENKKNKTKSKPIE